MDVTTPHERYNNGTLREHIMSDLNKPWHLTVTRRNRRIVVDTFDKPTEVLIAVMQLSDPGNVEVRYLPGCITLTGASFIRVCDNLLFAHMFKAGLTADRVRLRGNRGWWLG